MCFIKIKDDEKFELIKKEHAEMRAEITMIYKKEKKAFNLYAGKKRLGFLYIVIILFSQYIDSS